LDFSIYFATFLVVYDDSTASIFLIISFWSILDDYSTVSWTSIYFVY